MTRGLFLKHGTGRRGKWKGRGREETEKKGEGSSLP